MRTNSSGDEWSGYGKNWDDAMVLNDVDLTGADRAFMSVELFRSLGYGALGQYAQTTTGGQVFVPGDIWDDLALIEVYSEDSGWNLVACPGQAAVAGACASGATMWGGFDNDRVTKQLFGYYPESRTSGLFYSGTHYGWDNFTEEGLGVFDLSPWANETVDIRFRFRTGLKGQLLTITKAAGPALMVLLLTTSPFGSKTPPSSPTHKRNQRPSVRSPTSNQDKISPGQSRRTFSTIPHIVFLPSCRATVGTSRPLTTILSPM